MGLFSFKPKVKKFKSGKVQLPEFTTKEALPNDDTIRHYFYHYCLKGLNFGDELEMERIQNTIGEKIKELYDAGKIDKNADWVQRARKRFFPTEQEANLQEQKYTDFIAEGFNQHLKSLEKYVMSDEPSNMSSFYYEVQNMFEGDLTSHGYGFDWKEKCRAYFMSHFDDVIDVILKGIEVAKTETTQYFMSYFLLKDFVYLKMKGFNKANADIQEIIADGVLDEIPFCCILKKSEFENTPYFRLIKQKWSDKELIETFHQEARSNIQSITKDNYMEVVSAILTQNKLTSTKLKESRVLLAKGLDLYKNYMFDDELQEGLSLIQQASDLGNQEAYRWLLDYRSDNNDGYAQYLKSLCYRDGLHGYEKNKDLEKEWLIKAVRNNDPKACYDYGNQIIRRETDRAFKLFLQVAKQEDIYGYLGMAKVYVLKNQMDEALKMSQKVQSYPMNDENSVAIFEARAVELETMLAPKSTLPHNNIKRCFRFAMDLIEDLMIRENSNPLYKAYLALMNEPTIEKLKAFKGNIGMKNFKYPMEYDYPLYLTIRSVEAIEWHKEASRGSARAYYELHLFYNHVGNKKEAIHWGRLALDEELPDALYDAAHYPHLFDLYITPEQALGMIRQAADAGHSGAKTEMFLKEEELKQQLRLYKGTLENDKLTNFEKKDKLEQIEKNISHTMLGESHTLESALDHDHISYAEYSSIKSLKDFFLKD